MKLSGISLRHKISFSYIILLAVIGSMVAILAYEHDQIKEIGTESYSVRISRQHINNIHRHITELATLGESVMSWDSTDYDGYREKRQEIDSLLQDLKLCCSTFARPEQIDLKSELGKGSRFPAISERPMMPNDDRRGSASQ